MDKTLSSNPCYAQVSHCILNLGVKLLSLKLIMKEEGFIEEGSTSNKRKNSLSHWNKLISKVEIEMLCFDFVDKFYLVENIVKTKTKEKWVKEGKILVSSRLYVNS